MFKVYFVDDEELLLRELIGIIDWNAQGFEICGYNTDPVAAKEEILALKPALVLSDVRMDVLSGLELAEKIAEKEPEIFFAFLSAYDSFESAVKALKIGARDYLTKPISAVELVGLLSKVKAAKETELAAERVGENRESETAAADAFIDGRSVVECMVKDIHNSYGEKQSLTAYASKYGFNASYLSQMFKKALDVSFKEYVLDYRIRQAKEQIENTNRSMRDISSRVGYDDYFQFSKIFKKVVGVSPTEYRAGLRRTGKQFEK